MPFDHTTPPGLSPRLRGNRRCWSCSALNIGSIPAPAGEPTGSVRKSLPFWVYPRACGGTRVRTLRKLQREGLSPRLRGNLEPAAFFLIPKGSIHAPAGEPPTQHDGAKSYSVYPRACGGTFLAGAGLRYGLGLSPRLRGNPAAQPAGRPAPGSIPAPAGEPTTCCCRARSRTVYPRACGGTKSVLGVRNRDKGLSPRLRGNHRAVSELPVEFRSIPAPAGEPTLLPRSICMGSVYPRACGGTVLSSTVNVPHGGLSPRLRGNRR